MKMLNFQALGGAIAFGQSGPGQGKREVLQCREVPERVSNEKHALPRLVDQLERSKFAATPRSER